MEATIRPLRPEEIPVIEEIAVLAWRRIYEHFHELQQQRLGTIARAYSLEDKRRQVREFSLANPGCVLVSELAGEVVGFITFTLDRERKIGVIGNNAVRPEHAGKGIGSAQYRAVLEIFRREGMQFASVTTGLDEAHAPARKAYEKVGFVPVLSFVEYMMVL